jgi:hypothetical protein
MRLSDNGRRRRHANSMKSMIPPSRSWVTARVVSEAVTAQTLLSTGSVVKS